ncbi:MAG: CHAT domain-containing protein [Leptolyngbya sp. SIO3F4]|nr:CHAT domain-containing protein [Leptolyngbya sp. SIO3F4]
MGKQNTGHSRAVDTHKRIIQRARERGNVRAEASAWVALGDAYLFAILTEGQTTYTVADAVDAYSNGLSLTEKLLATADPETTQTALLLAHEAHYSLGLLYMRVDSYVQALGVLETSLDIAQQLSQPDKANDARVHLAGAYWQLGEDDVALGYLLEAADQAKTIGDPYLKASNLINLANVYVLLGEFSEAIYSYETALALGERHNFLGVQQRATRHLGQLYQSREQYERAIFYLEQSLAMATDLNSTDITFNSAPTTLIELGKAYLGLGEHQQALGYFDQVARALPNVPEDNRAIAYIEYGATLAAAGRYAAAEVALSKGIRLQDSVRGRVGPNDTFKVSIFERYPRAYRLLQQVHVAQNNISKALEVAEQGRARALSDLLAQQITSSPSAVPALDTTIDLATIQALARQLNATLVEYSLVDSGFPYTANARRKRLYIWVVSPDGTVQFKQRSLDLGANDLTDLVQQTRQSMGLRGNEQFVDRGGLILAERPTVEDGLQTLYNVLIQPIETLLPEDPEARVVFVPQGELFLVPFAALQAADGSHLIDHHTLITTPSLQTLVQTEQLTNRTVSGTQALIVGDPAMPAISPRPGEAPKPLAQLPGARAEAETISTLLASPALIGSAARKSVVVNQMPQADIIHLATHGLLDDVRGLGSAIALTPDPGAKSPTGSINGLLTAEEINQLELKANLVVLSACNTGRGRITGDGVIGLSRSFIGAGVPSVLVSLWAVPDAPTAELMKTFYSQLQQGQDKAAALRQAMLQTKAQYPDDPLAWAAFTLIGSPQ